MHIPKNNPTFEEKLVEKRDSLEEQADHNCVHDSLPCRGGLGGLSLLSNLPTAALNLTSSTYGTSWTEMSLLTNDFYEKSFY